MHLFLNLPVSADDSGVILSVDEIGNRQQGVICHFSAKIHCNLTRIHISGLSLLAADLRWCQMKMFRHGIDDHLGIKTAALLRRNKILKNLFRQFKSDRALFEDALCPDAVEAALKFTDVGFDIFGNIIEDIITDVISVEVFFFAENSHSRLVIR